MNLSCGNCKTIQPFSGNPPKCDVCGWVCGTESSQPSPNYGWEKKTFQKLLGLATVVIFFGLVWTYWMMPEKQRLAEKYNVSQDKVFIEPKPHGCDFDDAPLGNKHCHYEKVLETEKACPAPDCRVTGVYVSWHRLEE